jgi:DHA1 family tetracycline resistance protein-like MFS transporter
MKLSSLFRGQSAFLKGNFLILTLSWAVMYFAQPIPATYASLYYLSLGANAFLLSVIGFAGSIAVALVQFPGGYLADKHGRRWLIVVMTYILALCTFFFILAPSWQIIVLGIMLQNLCLIYQPAIIAMVIDSLPPKNRGAGYAFQSTVSILVTLPGPLIAQFLILTLNFDIGMRVAYVIVLVMYLVAATLRLKLKETLVSNNSAGRLNIVAALKEYPKSVKESLNVWRKVPRSAFYLFLSGMGINGVVVSCQTYFVVYATLVLKITEAQWAVVMAFMYLSIAAPLLLAGLRMDVVGRKRYLILGYLLYVPGMLLFVTADFYLALLAFFFYGLGNMLQMNSFQILLGDLIPRRLRGTVSGCMQFFMYLAQAFLQILIGLLYAYVSPQLPFLLLAIVAVPLALLIVYNVTEPNVKED